MVPVRKPTMSTENQNPRKRQSANILAFNAISQGVIEKRIQKIIRLWYEILMIKMLVINERRNGRSVTQRDASRVQIYALNIINCVFAFEHNMMDADSLK